MSVSTTRTYNGNLQTAAPGAPFNAVWVRLVSNSTGQAFVSSTASTASGDFTCLAVPVAQSFAIQTAPASTGPWTARTIEFRGEEFPDATYAPSLTPASVAANTTAEQTFTVTGLKVGDIVVVNPPSFLAGIALCASRVSAVDTIAITWDNPTAGALTPPTGTYRILGVRT